MCDAVVVGADGLIRLIMLVNVYQCCRLLMCVYLTLFKTLSLPLNLVNKNSAC